MLKENWRFIDRIERLGDLVITVLAFITAYYGRESLRYWDERFDLGLPFVDTTLAPIGDYIPVVLVAVISTLAFLQLMNAYQSMRMMSQRRLFAKFVVCSAGVFMTLAAVLFTLKIEVSRSFIGLFCVLLALSLMLERYLVLAVLRYFRRQGFNFRNVIICGISEQALKLAEEIIKCPELGVRVRCFADLRGRYDLRPEMIDRFKFDLRRVGAKQTGRIIFGTAELERALEDYAIDEVIFTNIVETMAETEAVVSVCAEHGVRTTIAADLFSIGIMNSGISYFGGMPLIHFQTPPGDRWELAVKRAIDVVISAVLLVALLPVFLVTGLLVKATSAGPIFFVQRRTGLNGRIFNLYKFRSMFDGAEKKLVELKSRNEMSGPVFKIADDPRVTWLGKFLRKYSLDELPQLWNVLRGDMSLVGPRPPVPGEVSAYERRYRRRLSMRPGITCTWQVSGRNNIKDFESWVKLDLDYIDNWSLKNDVVLLFKTIPAVIMGTGAR